MNNKRNKLVKETNKKKTEFSSKIRKTNKKITELQKKLGVSVTEEQKKPVSAKLKTIPNQKKTKKVFKKVIKKVPKKKMAKKPKIEKDMFTKVNETINKMVEKITKVVSEQLVHLGTVRYVVPPRGLQGGVRRREAGQAHG